MFGRKKRRHGEMSVISQHRFKRPGIRLWLPVTMLLLLALCGWAIAPRVRIPEFLAFLFMLYVAISALVSVGEIVVVEPGLIINRLLLPERFVPWDAINRVLVYTREDEEVGARIEVTSISFHEGLSPLNRLPGLVYGQGFRQTIILTPDTVEDYEVLLAELEARSPIYWRSPSRQ